MRIGIVGAGMEEESVAIVRALAAHQINDVVVISAEEAKSVFKKQITIPIRSFEIANVVAKSYIPRRKSDDQPWKKHWKR